MTTNYRKAKAGQALRFGSIIIVILALCAANLFIWAVAAKAETTTFTPYHVFKSWVLPAGVSTQSTPVWSQDIFPQDVYVNGNEYCNRWIQLDDYYIDTIEKEQLLLSLGDTLEYEEDSILWVGNEWQINLTQNYDKALPCYDSPWVEETPPAIAQPPVTASPDGARQEVALNDVSAKPSAEGELAATGYDWTGVVVVGAILIFAGLLALLFKALEKDDKARQERWDREDKIQE